MNTVPTIAPKTERFGSLIGDLQTDVKNYIKKEIELAKTEMGENFSKLGKNAGLAAAGGVLGLFALMMLLIALGMFFGGLIQKADLSPGTSYFLSFLGLALLVGGVGYALIHKATNGFSEFSLSPQKAIAAAKGEEVPIHLKVVDKEKDRLAQLKPSSEELKDQVVHARERMDAELAELKDRLTPKYMAKSLWAGLKHHPVRTLLIGSSTALGGYLYWRNKHMLEIRRLNAQRKWWQFKVRHA